MRHKHNIFPAEEESRQKRMIAEKDADKIRVQEPKFPALFRSQCYSLRVLCSLSNCLLHPPSSSHGFTVQVSPEYLRVFARMLILSTYFASTWDHHQHDSIQTLDRERGSSTSEIKMECSHEEGHISSSSFLLIQGSNTKKTSKGKFMQNSCVWIALRRNCNLQRD